MSEWSLEVGRDGWSRATAPGLPVSVAWDEYGALDGLLDAAMGARRHGLATSVFWFKTRRQVADERLAQAVRRYYEAEGAGTPSN